MTTLKATMNLMALLKAGCKIAITDRVKFFRRDNRIVVQRPINGFWFDAIDFPLTKDGLAQCVEYINLPF